MAANVKRSDNLEKHLTKAEKEARQAAEADFLPDRPAQLKPPKGLKAKDPAAHRYWTSIVKRMEGLGILDDLDGEVLAVYCTTLSRRDSMQDLSRAMVSQVEETTSAKDKLEMMGQIDSRMSRLNATEKQLLSYADKLGLTPESRIRMARKQAAQTGAADPNADLFGD